MARLGRCCYALVIFHSTEFENLDESHLFALTTTDLVADGPDHVGGHGMRTGLRDDQTGERLSPRHLPGTACSFRGGSVTPGVVSDRCGNNGKIWRS
jgi:hypothetical protein